jgi:hypothetical protein
MSGLRCHCRGEACLALEMSELRCVCRGEACLALVWNDHSAQEVGR